jgi:hypothetical protein
MSNRIKLKGTTERAFDLGLTNKQTFDASNLTANRTWVLPDSNGNTGDVLRTDGSGNLSWSSTGGDLTQVDSITFDTTAGEETAVAKLFWNDGEGSLSLGLKGGNVTVNIGQNLYTLVHNEEATTITKGQVVYVFGAQGQRPSVKLALATGDTTSARTLGVVAETISSGAEGFICIEGNVDNINTTGLVEGGQLYLSGTTPGAFTQTKPQAPVHLVYVGLCLKVHASSGRIQVKVQNGYELDELHDVKITTPVTNNSVLQYDSANSVWVNNGPTTAINTLLPTQTGNANRFLSTNGSGVLNWANTINFGNLVYNGTTLTLGDGVTNGVVIDKTDNSITSVGANNLKLQSAGTDVIIESSGVISSDAITIGSTVGDITLLMQTTKTVKILGPTPTQYAANLTNESLVNKKYVDDLIAQLQAQIDALTP